MDCLLFRVMFLGIEFKNLAPPKEKVSKNTDEEHDWMYRISAGFLTERLKSGTSSDKMNLLARKIGIPLS